MTKNSRKLPLTDWQIEDSRRLKEIFQGKRAALNLTQEKIANELGDGVTQGAVSHFMNGRTALSLKAAVVFARMLQVPIAEFSPTIAKQYDEMRVDLPFTEYGRLEYPDGKAADAVQEEPHRYSANKEAANTPLPNGAESDDALDDRYAYIPQYDAKAAAGLGVENPHVEIRATLAFKREWLKVKRVKPEKLLVIYADGESMWPTINDRDVLLVDQSKIEPADGQVFVLTHGETAIVKRLVKSTRGAWIIRSDNGNKEAHPDRMLTTDDANEHRIIGKVIWRGGDL
jgi:phage repressor protein C with HTH and peptisase S24 domain/DNA-binding XRE family transcriptional regulator